VKAELQGLHAPGPRETIDLPSGSSLGLRLLFRGCPSTEPLHRAFGFPPALRSGSAERPSAAPPLRFRPLQRFPARSSGMNGRTYLARPPAPSGFRNLLAPSSAPSLPALFHAGSAPGVNPPELSSSRAAVRCFQRLSPLGVRAAFRVFLRARVRHSTQRFRLKSSAWLSWAFSPPGFSFSLRWSDLRRSSPHAVTLSDASGRTGSTSGSLTQRVWLVSLETADPPGVCGLVVVMPA
jgi:hypothetical protein